MMTLWMFAALLIVAQVEKSLAFPKEQQDQQVSDVCDTRNTKDGKCCVFPFTYRDKEYYDCTSRDLGGEWCSLTNNYEKDKQWGYCATQTTKPIFDTILEAAGENAKYGKSRDGQTDLFQGDIQMTPDQWKDIRSSLNSRGIVTPGDDTSRMFPVGWPGVKPNKRPKRALMKTSRSDKRWPIGSSGKREIPYYIERSNQNVRGVIQRAMNHWMEKVPCMKFIPSTRGRYLSFFQGGGCYSLVGRQPGSGPQKISIGNGCGYLGVVVHEIGHALGFWHEQSRPDRDSYVTINWGNIQSGMAYNFHKYDTNRIDSRGVSYDYDSVMHYSSTAFANRAGVRTIVGKNGRTNLGQRYGLSTKDIQQANLLYCGRKPVTNPPPKPNTPAPPGCSSYRDRHDWCPYWKSLGYCTNSRYSSFMNKSCQKSCKCKNVVCQDTHKYCSGWKKMPGDYCTKYARYMSVYCRKSCGNC